MELKSSLHQILDKEFEIAEKNEILVGINPASYLGAEILKQSREILKLKFEIQDLKKMAAGIINRLDENANISHLPNK